MTNSWVAHKYIQTLFVELNLISLFWYMCGASLVSKSVKKPPAMQEIRVQSLGQEDPWRGAWQPTPVFLPGEVHGQRGLLGYSPWGHKDLDRNERLTLYVHDMLSYINKRNKLTSKQTQFSSVQSLSCVRLCDPMNLSTPGLPVHPNPCPFSWWRHPKLSL